MPSRTQAPRPPRRSPRRERATKRSRARRRARAGPPRRARSRARFLRRRSASRGRGSGPGANGPRAPSRAPGRPRAAPPRPRPAGPAPAAMGRVRSVARASAAHATATIIPSTGADGASRPVSSSTLGSHIAASRTTRPGSRGSRRASPAMPGDRDGPDQPEPDHGPSARAEVREPVSQLGEIRRTGVAPCLDRLSRHVVGDRDVQTLEHGGRDVGGADQPLRAGRVRIQRGAPAEPGGAGRHEPAGDVARVLDHQHQVGGATRCEELAELSMPGRPGWQLHDQHVGIAPQRARGARDRPGAHERHALDTTRPVGRDGRLPVTGCPRARVADMPAGLADGRRKQAWDHVGRSGTGPFGDRLPRGHAAARRKSQIGWHLVVVERRRRARARAHVQKGLLGRVGALDGRHEAEGAQARRLGEALDRGRLRKRLRARPEDDRRAWGPLSLSRGDRNEGEHQGSQQRRVYLRSGHEPQCRQVHVSEG